MHSETNSNNIQTMKTQLNNYKNPNFLKCLHSFIITDDGAGRTES